MLKYNPDTLVNYATQAYGDYVRSLCRQWMPYFQHEMSMTEETLFDRLRRWIPFLRHNTFKRLDIKHVENVCDRLCNMLACTLLPSQVANNVTGNLLICVDNLFDADSLEKFTADDEFILSCVASVLIHPSVTEINLESSDFRYFYGRLIDQYVRENLSQLRFLKVLNLGILSVPELIDIPSQNLQELTFSGVPYGAPKIKAISLLEQFLNSCHNLKSLKIYNSRIDDVGLKYLLKFTQMEHLEFDGIEGFSDEGMTELLEGLAKNTDGTGAPLLKIFKYSDLTPEQIDFVVHTFHLVSFCVKEPVEHICYPSHLQSLCIFGTFCSIKAALQAVGHQLSHLELYCDDRVDLSVVAECCPVLVSLMVLCYGGDMLNDSDVSLPSFSKLKVVDIYGSCPKLLICILTNCTNLKVLKLEYIEILKILNIADVLDKNPLRCIEELQLVVSYSNVDIQILQHCQAMHRYFWQSQTIKRTESWNVRVTNAVILPDI